MTRVVAQTRSVRKMELLTGELRLLKGAMELMSLRLEFLLAEIADLQLDHRPAKQELDGQLQPAAKDDVVGPGDATTLEPDERVVIAPSDKPADEATHLVEPMPEEIRQQDVVVEVLAEFEPASAVVVPPVAIKLSSNIITLDERRELATRNVHPTIRAVGRWAAVVALMVFLGAGALAGTGFASSLSELLSNNGSCSDLVPICALRTLLSFWS